MLITTCVHVDMVTTGSYMCLLVLGKVYRGVMSNNQHVAIKKITNDETFVREIRSLVHVKHPNLVPLLGYCENQSECFLIYELCPNGNLSDWLYGKRTPPHHPHTHTHTLIALSDMTHEFEFHQQQTETRLCHGFKGSRLQLAVLGG